MPQLPDELNRVFTGERSWAVRAPGEKWETDFQVPPSILFPGSFNPLHEGHIKLADLAGEKLQSEVCYEMTIRNADKPALQPDEIIERVQQFHQHTLVVTNLPTFVEKSRCFPKCCFVIGVDTAMRIVDRRFYDNSQNLMSASLQKIAENGCHFLVAPRIYDEKLLTLSSLSISSAYEPLFEEISPEEFRVDLSSTYLRGCENG